MAIFFVDAFKVITLAQDQAKRRFCAFMHVELLCEQYFQVPAIKQAGELVGFGEALQFSISIRP